MKTLIPIGLLLSRCLMFGALLVQCMDELDKYDVYKATQINGGLLMGEYQALNAFLVDETNSKDAKDNFDITLEKMILDLKDNWSFRSLRVEAKRLFLALTTINEETQCSAYSHKVLSENDNASDNRAGRLKGTQAQTRIERILSTYLLQHANNCLPTYIDRYKRLVPTLDNHLLNRVEIFLQDLIKRYSIDLQNNLSEKYIETPVHRFYNIIIDRVTKKFAFDTNYLHDSLRLLSKDDPNSQFTEAIDDEKLGIKVVRKEQFINLYRKYIIVPCKYYVDKFRPSIFGPARFDSLFHRELQVKEEQFYLAWVRHDFCSLLLRDHNLDSLDNLIKGIEKYRAN